MLKNHLQPMSKINATENMNSIQRSLDEASKKAVTLKENLYAEWKSLYDSGKTKDDWSEFSKKLTNSQEMIQYVKIQEKYNHLVQNCVQKVRDVPESKPAAKAPDTKCSKADLGTLRDTLNNWSRK